MRSEDSPIANCPDDEMLTTLIERRVAGDQLARLELHVASCSTCLDVVAAMLPSSAETLPVGAPSVRSVGITATEKRALSGTRARRWAMAASVLLAVGGLLVATMQRPIGERVAPTLARWGSKIFGAQLGAKAIGVRLGKDPSTFVVTLHQVAIGHDPGMFASADEIGVTVALATLFSAEPLVRTVRVSRPRLDLGGRDLAGGLSSRAGRVQALTLLARVRRIDVVDGRVLLPGPGGVPLAVEGLTGGIERTVDGAHVVLQGHAAGGAVDVTGSISQGGHDLTLTIGGRNLDATRLPIAGEHMTGVVDFRLDVVTHGDVLRTNGRLAVRNGRLIGRDPVALLHLSPESRAILATRDSAFTTGDLPFDDARAIFAWRDGTWRFPRVFVTTSDVVAGGRGRITARGEMIGHGTLRLPPAMAGALQPHEPLLGSFRDRSGAATVRFSVGGPLQAPRFTLGNP